MDWNVIWSFIERAGAFVVLISGILLGLKTILEAAGRPIKLFKKKRKQETNETIDERLEEKLPKILLEHDLETRKKYRADRERYLQEIRDEILKNVQNELSQINNLTKQYEPLVCSARDVLREKIMAIYHKNKKTKTLFIYEKEALDQYYKDYKAMNGNSYIDKYYARMKDWKIVYDEDYDD